MEFRVGDFVFERPEGWLWQASASPMRKAQLLVRGAGGEVADVVFFHFGPGQGGSVEANVERWLQQMENPSRAATRTEDTAAARVTFVEAEGTFLSGMPGTPAIPMEGFALRGAILESPGGDVYVKFTGPAAAVLPASADFERMVRTARQAAD